MPSTTSTPGWASALTHKPDLDLLAGRLGHHFGDRGLLRLALTHRSWCAENPGSGSNERLEFLGDSVLGLAVTEQLYATHPERPEGDLARMRAAVVNSLALAEVARELELGSALLLGKGEADSGGRDRGSILADALEAVVAAVYLDGGWDAARQVVLQHMGVRIADAGVLHHSGDYKTRLQELTAARFEGELPSYDVEGSGPDHDKEFRAVVRIAGLVWGVGTGRSKKLAEQAAAGAAYATLVADERDPDGDPEGEQRSDA